MDMSIKYVNSERPCNKSVACLLPSVEDAGVAPTVSSSTPGRHPPRRLVEVGIRSVFSVPGDSNFTLLVEPGLNLSGCCNELNAGYAADGCTVTFTVRGLGVTSGAYSENLPVTCSVGGPNSSDYGTNGIAISGAYRENLAVTCSVGWPHSSDYGTNGIAISGAYSENLPVTCSVGGPNSSDHGTNGILHHTIALPGFSLEYRRFQTVTWIQVIVNHLDDAHKLTDYNISIALMESEHVYISISCNLAAVQHPAFSRQFVPYALSPRDGKSIEKCMVQTTQGNQLEVGIRSVFSVPGDFNITLLVEPGLNLSGCCNELNAGYAADGCAVTFTVRDLGVTIAISGAYSENLPVTCSVGGPISSDYGTNGVAISGSYSENLPVTCTVGGPNFSHYGTNGIAISGAYRENLPVTCSVEGGLILATKGLTTL